ncbi:hypothetical protein [Trueperella pyogenes]|uniref:hypothetical protein n=1 Tax=Trueperella pyogenes TaxID=1661 RepID=UPI00345CFFEA
MRGEILFGISPLTNGAANSTPLRPLSVFVVVVSVLSVTVAIMHVVHVIAVLDRLVATALAVLMFRGGMLRKLMVGHGISP